MAIALSIWKPHQHIKDSRSSTAVPMILPAGVVNGNKKGETSFETNFPLLVEPTGLEPVSKQIRHKPSTCLFVY